MSFRSARYTRFTITWSCLTLVLALTGCSTVSAWLPFGKDKKPPRLVLKTLPGQTAAPQEESQAATPDASQDLTPAKAADPLVYWEAITGGTVGNNITGKIVNRFIRPTAVAVRGDAIYVADAGHELLYRYDQVSGKLAALVDLKIFASGEVSDIYVTQDHFIFITDAAGHKVIAFDPKGSFIRTYENRLNLVDPVAVLVDEQTKNVFVADGEMDHVLLFNENGELLTAMGGRGTEPGRFLNITTMTRGPEGYYIAERIGHHVQVLDQNGTYLYSFAQQGVVFPLAVAADANFRSYVADYLDNSIKVYERGRYITSIGKTGAGPGEFKRITDLWLDNDLLYVADSLNGRIQVMRVSPLESTFPVSQE